MENELTPATQDVSQARDSPISRLNRRGRPFKKGEGGRPPGARNRATQLAEALLDGEAEELTRTAISMAIAGHPVALKLCMERLVPKRARTLSCQMPIVTNAAEAMEIIGGVPALLGAGDLTASDAQVLANVVDTQLRALEVADFDRRLTALEAPNP